MRCFRPYEVITAIVRRSHNHVMAGERLERVFKNRRRQMRDVAVEGDDALVANGRKVRKCRVEARREALSFLAQYARHTGSQLRQFFDIGSRAHNGDVNHFQRVRQRDCVVQKATIEFGDRLNWKARR